MNDPEWIATHLGEVTLDITPDLENVASSFRRFAAKAQTPESEVQIAMPAVAWDFIADAIDAMRERNFELRRA